MSTTPMTEQVGPAPVMTYELEALLERLGKRGCLLYAFRSDQHGPEIMACVLDYGGVADVVILFDGERAAAHRTPAGPGIDLFAPRRVFWWYAHSPVWTLRALLTLDPPATRTRRPP